MGVRPLLRAGDGTRGEVEGPEFGRHPSSHGERLYVAHMEFSNLKHELSFKHPRSLPQNPGFLLLCKKLAVLTILNSQFASCLPHLQ